MKPIHGAAKELWEKFELSPKPPVECKFNIGDKVVFTNEAGIKFDMDVIGFSEDTSFYGKFIHIVSHGSNGDGSAWWFPHHPLELQPYL